MDLLYFLYKFILRDVLYYSLRLSGIFANIFIKPFTAFSAKKLKEEIKAGTIRKVLVNRSDQIGDAVVSLKFIRALAQKFEEVNVLVSEKNRFIFENEKGIKLIIEKKPHKTRSLFSLIAYFFREAVASFLNPSQIKPQYDLIIDLIGDFSIRNRYPARHMIGPNRGPFSFFYSCFYKTNFSAAGKQVLEAYQEMIEGCLDIKLSLDDLPQADFSKEKKKQIFIFTGNKPERNLPYEKWKEIILGASAIAPVIVADDPDQRIMQLLKDDHVIKNNKKIKLIVGKRELDELARIANQSALLVALDGGGEHYLERYTNALVLYTCGLAKEWKPYSLNPYKQILLEKEHVLEETLTSAGLKKVVLYIEKNRKPCYDLLCDYAKWKNLDPYIIQETIKHFDI